MALITVQIEWPEDLRALPPNARARVTVEDTTRSDESSVVLGEAILDDVALGRSAVAQVEVGEADPDSDLSVRVHVSDANRKTLGVEVGDLVTTQSHPVLTHGRGDSVVVGVRVVGS